MAHRPTTRPKIISGDRDMTIVTVAGDGGGGDINRSNITFHSGLVPIENRNKQIKEEQS